MRVATFSFALILAAAWDASAGDDLERAGPIGGYDWTGWTSRGGITVSGPDCVAASSSRIDCFARGHDGQLWRLWWDGSVWRAWTSAPGVANDAFYLSRPECVSAEVDHVDCFVRRHGDGALFRRTWDGGYEHSWENLGGHLSSDPDCVTRKARRIDCFARGEDGAMWQNAFDGQVWSGWLTRGGELASQSKPACASRAVDKVDCVVVWADKTLRHFAVHSPRDKWKVVSRRPTALPSAENAGASPKCHAAPDDERVDCFAPVEKSKSKPQSLLRLSFDGGWTVSDLASDFGRADAPARHDLSHYDFDCVVRRGERLTCLELLVWRRPTGTAGGEKIVRFRHMAYVMGPPAHWRNVPLTMPIEAGNVTFLKCLALGEERIECFTGGSWLGNSTLNQASFVYQERITFRPMTPVR